MSDTENTDSPTGVMSEATGLRGVFGRLELTFSLPDWLSPRSPRPIILRRNVIVIAGLSGSCDRSHFLGADGVRVGSTADVVGGLRWVCADAVGAA